jgi:serine/threonine protein kinase
MPMTPDERDIEELLEAVASGGPADWARAEARATGGREQARVRALRDLARLADFHRGLQHGAGEGAGFEGGRWGELLLLEQAGSGSAGEVYRAWDPALRRDVALKLSRAGEAPASMLDEARALARVRDPHVVVVHGAAEHDGRAGFWMEYLRGATLESEMARRGPLPAAEVARLGAQMARALAAAHAAGALHRDVKPANVILESDGRFVLVDFGLGQHAGVEPDRARPFSGTPLFMSPQRLAGGAASSADDLYALGVTLWLALAGRAPFQAGSLDALRAEAATGPAEALASACPDAPAPLVAAIEHLMTPRPADRFASAAQAQVAFEALETRTPVGIVAAPVAPRRANVAVPLMVVAVAAVVAFAIWSRRPHAAAPAPPAIAAPVAYDVSATLVRSNARGETALASGDRVGPGDQLQLEFRATRPAWVYVLNSDDRGESYLLFPQPLFDRTNPVPADSTVRLPGMRAGRESGWVVTSRGGHEHFLIVAGPAPVPELEAELSRLPAPTPDHAIQYARIGAASMERLRGVGGVSDLPVRAPGSASADVFGRFRSLAGREHGVSGTWVRQVTLSNPER